MDIIIRGSKLEITDAMEEYAKEKLTKLDRYIDVDDAKATVLVKVLSSAITFEISLSNLFKVNGGIPVLFITSKLIKYKIEEIGTFLNDESGR